MGHKAAAFEAIQANFDTLFEIVSDTFKTLAKDGTRKASRREPRGEPGAREYWVESKKRWVQVSFKDVAGTGLKKRRTLTKRASNPSALLPSLALVDDMAADGADMASSSSRPSSLQDLPPSVEEMQGEDDRLDQACDDLF